MAQGEKIPFKGGPTIAHSDLLIIIHTDLTLYISASLEAMEADTIKMRDGRLYVLTDLLRHESLDQIIAFIGLAIERSITLDRLVQLAQQNQFDRFGAGDFGLINRQLQRLGVKDFGAGALPRSDGSPIVQLPIIFTRLVTGTILVLLPILILADSMPAAKAVLLEAASCIATYMVCIEFILISIRITILGRRILRAIIGVTSRRRPPYRAASGAEIWAG